MADVDEKMVSSKDASAEASRQVSPIDIGGDKPKKSFGAKAWEETKKPGSAIQIIIAAALAIGIGLGVSAAVDEVPEAAIVLVAIPGNLWLRALKAVVIPLIVTAMILAMQHLRDMMGKGRHLVWWTIGWYVGTTVFAVVQSCVMVSQVWEPLMVPTEGDKDTDLSDYEDAQEETKIYDVVNQMFESFIPKNVVGAFNSDDLLAIVIMSILIGLLVKGPNSPILRLTREVERIVTIIITFLIHIAPIGVFFLILPNLFKIDIPSVGRNLGVLIGGTICDIFIHLFIVLPLLFWLATRTNPFIYWLKCSRAWITAWGTASSAATLSVSMDCAKERGVPKMIRGFVLGCGCSVNMDGTAIYFPIIVMFMAASQGIQLTAANYVMICLLSTLAAIGTTPIPSSSLILTLMIAAAVDVPVTSAYGLAVAMDWFLDRFRTACNVSGDLYAAKAVAILGGFDGIKDDELEEEVGQVRNNDNAV